MFRFILYVLFFNNFPEEPTVCLKKSDQSQAVAYGNTITLQADIKSYPAPCIRWTCKKNGNNEETIEESEKIEIDSSNLSCQKLTIKDLEINDNGNYIITVTNDFGSVKANFEIKIQGNHFLLLRKPN